MKIWYYNTFKPEQTEPEYPYGLIELEVEPLYEGYQHEFWGYILKSQCGLTKQECLNNRISLAEQIIAAQKKIITEILESDEYEKWEPNTSFKQQSSSGRDNPF